MLGESGNKIKTGWQNPNNSIQRGTFLEIEKRQLSHQLQPQLLC
jgi:hypothetical protein